MIIAAGISLALVVNVSVVSTPARSTTLDLTSRAAPQGYQISTGNHGCAVSASGEIRCWGSNRFGQLGDGTQRDSIEPVLVSGITDAVQVTTGGYTSCAVLASGSVTCWGGSLVRPTGDLPSRWSTVPVSLSSYISDATSVSLSSSFACLLRASGQVWCWGMGRYGELGIGPTEIKYAEPIPVTGISDAVAVSTGTRHSCAVLATGVVKCWGSFEDYLNGPANEGPVKVSNLKLPATQIDLGDTGDCALLQGGTVKCWGTGVGSSAAELWRVNSKPISNAVSISVGLEHACSVISTGEVFCWGLGAYGQLGNGTNNRFDDPVKVTSITNAVKVYAGSNHSYAVLKTGEVVKWGQGVGPYADAAPTDVNVPISAGWPLGKVVSYGYAASVSWLASLTTTPATLTDYVLEYRAVSATNWIVYSHAPSTAQKAVIHGLTPGAEYEFKVTAVDGSPAPGSIVLATTHANTPSTGSLSSAGSSIELTWTADGVTEDNSGFRVQYAFAHSTEWTNYASYAAGVRGTTLTGLDPEQSYAVRVLGDDVGATPLVYQSEVNMPNNGRMSPSLNSLAFSWPCEVAPSGVLVSDFLIDYKPLGSENWNRFADGISTSHKATVTGLKQGTHYELKVSPVVGGATLQGTIYSASTGGTGTLQLVVTDSTGLPVALGEYTWTSIDGLNRSSSAKTGTALGGVTFNSVPAKMIKVKLDSGSLVDGSLVSGTFTTQATNGIVMLSLPPATAQVRRVVEVQLPSGDPVPGAQVTSQRLTSSAPFSSSTFSGTVSRSSTLSGKTNSAGQIELIGYSTGVTRVSANYDDGELNQSTLPQDTQEPITIIQLDYMPIVTVTAEQVTATANTIVSIPVSVGDPVDSTPVNNMSLAVLAHGVPQRSTQAYSGVKVGITPPAGAAQTACAGTKVLSATTNAQGKATLKVCAAASGDYIITSKGAVSAGAVRIRVKNSKPMAVSSLGAQSKASGAAQVAWAAPEYDGGSPLTSVTVTAKSGTTAVTKTFASGIAAFTNRTYTFTGLAPNKVWTFTVTPSNKFGAGPVATTTAIVRGVN